VDRGAGQQPIDIGRVRAVPAHQPVLAQGPDVASARGGRVRQPGRAVLDDPVQVLPGRDDLVEQGADLLLAEADAVERVGLLQGLQQLPEGRQVERGQVPRAVERDPERRRLQVVDLELDNVALRPAERLHGLEAPVAPDHAPGRLLDDERVNLPEAREGGADRIQAALVVRPGVGRVRGERRERDAADGQVGGRLQSQAPRSLWTEWAA
jgi:hypothetical protein